MNSKLFIPSKIKAGFNPRSDTYSGKLAYVIGLDGKKWRKEPSWLGWIYNYSSGPEIEIEKKKQFDENTKRQTEWYHQIEQSVKNNPSAYQSDHYYRDYLKDSLEGFLEKRVGTYKKFQPNIGRKTNDKSMIPVELDNVPTEGFVLNKKVGGYSSGWDHRATYCRVYDPRGFEFEISMENLLFILAECNSMKGKGLEGEFVYAWSGKDLVLLPTSSEDYTASNIYTKAQSGKVSAKELEVGLTYKHKSMDDYVYLGRFNYFNENYSYRTELTGLTCKKAHIFYNITSPKDNEFIGLTALAPLISKVTDSQISNFSEIFDKFTKSKHNQDLHLAKLDNYFNGSGEDCLIELEPNKYEVYTVHLNTNSYHSYSTPQRINSYSLYGKSIITINGSNITTKSFKNDFNQISIEKFREMKPKVLKIKQNNKSYNLIF